MSHAASMYRMFRLRSKYKQYQKTKKVTLALREETQPPRLEIRDRLNYFLAKYVYCGYLKSSLRKNAEHPVASFIIYSTKSMRTYGTFANYVATSILGFLGGVFLTYLYFIFTTVVVDVSVPTTWYFSVLLCIFLTIGLAFNDSVRVVVMSILPELFTRKVRGMLVSYALLLLLTGPGANISYNTKQLTDTMVCTKEQLKEVSHNLTELYRKPLRAIKKAVKDILEAIKPPIEHVKNILKSIERKIRKVVNTIRKILHWLNEHINGCNSKVSDPVEACFRAVDRALEDCYVRLTKPFSYVICQADRLLGLLCYGNTLTRLVCNIRLHMNFGILETIEEKLSQVGRYIKTLFYVSVTFQHSFAFDTNSSKSIKQVVKDTYNAEQRRVKLLFMTLHLAQFLFGFYIIYLLFSVFVYRLRFFRSPSFDNYYVNRYLVDLDFKRATANKQTLFPLTQTERKIYTSDSFVLLATMAQMLFIFIIDFALFEVLKILDDHGRIRFHFGNRQAQYETVGTGFSASIYSIVNFLLKPYDLEFRFDSGPCLPEPIPITFPIYKRVLIIFLIAWFTIVFQPIGLRLRNFIMTLYYPDVARKRAVWLYNYIFQYRTNLTLYIRRQVRNKFGGFGLPAEKPNLRFWLLARFSKLKYILPYKTKKQGCELCGYLEPDITCSTPDCNATYCKECFESLGKKCIKCQMVADADLMDVSEEEDSEDDDIEPTPSPDTIPKWKFWEHLMTINRDNKTWKDCEMGVEMEQKSLLSGSQNTSNSTQVKDYFGERWRRSHWACMEDFDLPSSSDEEAVLENELNDTERTRGK